jgi:hypothetical protein
MPLSRTEYIARTLLRHYLPRERFLYGLRPDWLKNPETGHNLEIDIWMPERGIGFEINGSQHGRPIKGLQRDFAAFERQQRHDMLKYERCKERGYTLYSLTIFDLTQRRFEPFVKAFMAQHGLGNQFRLTSPPPHLFAEAERLSQARVIKRRLRKPGLWPMLKRVFG